MSKYLPVIKTKPTPVEIAATKQALIPPLKSMYGDVPEGERTSIETIIALIDTLKELAIPAKELPPHLLEEIRRRFDLITTQNSVDFIVGMGWALDSTKRDIERLKAL